MRFLRRAVSSVEAFLLSILYVRFQSEVNRAQEEGDPGSFLTFNSLCEIQMKIEKEKLEAEKSTFNSLCEIPAIEIVNLLTVHIFQFSM